MLNFITELNHWFWFSCTVLLICLEVLLGVNLFLLWVSCSAAIVGIILLISPQFPWEYQLLLFSAVTLTLITAWSVLTKSRVLSSTLNRRTEKYLGKSVFLVQAIVNGRGLVSIDDSYWRVSGIDMPAGSLVNIVAIDGLVLKVEPA